MLNHNFDRHLRFHFSKCVVGGNKDVTIITNMKVKLTHYPFKDKKGTILFSFFSTLIFKH